MATQLRDLRAKVARHCDDWIKFTATSASSDTTVYIDEVNGYENDHHFTGTDLWFKNDQGTASNRGILVRVIDSTQFASALSLGNGLIAIPQIGDEAWGFNIGGMGNRFYMYNAVINDAIQGLGEAGNPVYEETLPAVWDSDVAWVSIPDDFTHVGTAQYYDTNGNWNDVPSHALAVDLVNKSVALSYDYAYHSNGFDVRLLGRKAHPELALDTDTTDIDPEWLAAEAASSLLLNKRDQLKVNKGGALKNLADAVRGKASPFNLIEGMIRVR